MGLAPNFKRHKRCGRIVNTSRSTLRGRANSDDAPRCPTLLLYGFRPFFLAAGIWSLLAMVIWIGLLETGLTLPIATDPVTWHVHELLFGYLTAAIAGFLLTAIPNWTGRLPIRGWPLGALAALWSMGRLASLFSAEFGPTFTAAIDLSFLAALLALVLREIVTGRNWRNLPMVGAVFLLFIANLLTHLDELAGGAAGQIGLRLGIATVTALIALIGGRIIPSFTRNWLKKTDDQRLPATFGATDRLAILLLIAALAAWITAPDTLVTALLSALAAAAHFVRLLRWRGERVLGEPLLWILHLGYLWLPVGLGLLSLGAAGLASTTAGVHALTAGAMGTMTLAVMTRATRGHTGNELTAGPRTTAVFVFITIAAGSRVVASLFGGSYGLLLNGAALFWILAFGLFLVLYAPMLLGQTRSAST